MVSMAGIMAGAAAGLAVVVTALVIGVCLLTRWAIDTFRGTSQREAGSGARTGAPPAAGNWYRNAPGMPAASRRGGRLAAAPSFPVPAAGTARWSRRPDGAGPPAPCLA